MYVDPLGLFAPAAACAANVPVCVMVIRICAKAVAEIIKATASGAMVEVVNCEGPEACGQNGCPACSPYPVGTVGYQGPKTSVDGVDGTRGGSGKEHYILFEVQQNPKNCQCRWQETKKIAGHHYYFQPNIFYAVNLNGKARPHSYP